MSAFGIVESLSFAHLGVDIVDLRTLSVTDDSLVRALWHDGMQSLLVEEGTFIPKETCINPDCLAPLSNAYVDHVEAVRSQGLEPLSYETFSEQNFDQLVPDYISKPHLPMHWFAIRATGQQAWSGAFLLSNITEVKRDSQLLTLGGWPVVVHPAIGGMDAAAVAGAISRFLMDTDLITVDTQEPNVDIVEWHLPVDIAARYVERGTNTYGRDVFEEMADGVRVRTDPASGDAPTDVKRELQPEDNAEEFPVYTRPIRTEPVEEVEPIPLDPSSSSSPSSSSP